MRVPEAATAAVPPPDHEPSPAGGSRGQLPQPQCGQAGNTSQPRRPGGTARYTASKINALLADTQNTRVCAGREPRSAIDLAVHNEAGRRAFSLTIPIAQCGPPSRRGRCGVTGLDVMLGEVAIRCPKPTASVAAISRLARRAFYAATSVNVPGMLSRIAVDSAGLVVAGALRGYRQTGPGAAQSEGTITDRRRGGRRR